MNAPEVLMVDRAANRKMSGVQAARGCAAILVVGYHAVRSLSLPQYLGYQPFNGALAFGHAGVDFFFVLSGFIITYAHSSDVGQPGRLGRYAWRRVTRIYPIYWFVTLIEVVRGLFAPDAATRLDPFHLAASFLLLPDDKWPLVSVAWTLRHEMLFYAVFAAAIANRQLARPLFAVAALSVIASAVVEPEGPWLSLALSPFNLEFLVGIGVARFLANRRVPKPRLALACGIACFLLCGTMEAAGYVPLNGLLGRSLYGAASGTILLGLVEAERAGLLRFGAVSAFFGEISYCLYLVHLSVMPVTVRTLAKLGMLRPVPDAILVAGLVILSTGAAVILHLWVERPMMACIRKHMLTVMK